jgi:hypothetical protein
MKIPDTVSTLHHRLPAVICLRNQAKSHSLSQIVTMNTITIIAKATFGIIIDEASAKYKHGCRSFMILP